MDAGFIFWPKYLNFNNFSICLNDLHPAIKYTIEKSKVIVQNPKYCQVVNFLHVSVKLHPDRTNETDMNYSDTNAHDYLPHYSTHPDYSIDNVPYS